MTEEQLEEPSNQLVQDNSDLDTEEPNKNEYDQLNPEYISEQNEAYFALKNEISRQHSLVSDYLNSLMQRIGIILAFGSLLFVESLNGISVISNPLNYLDTILLGLCCIAGIWSIINWKEWGTPLGVQIEIMIDEYNSNNFVKVHDSIIDEMIKAYDQTTTGTIVLKRWMIYETLLLAAGICLMLIVRVL
ncbi:MAG: hypothetical protein WCR96_05755 [Candidatus Methanomethylophilaceae archaeon]